MIETIGDMWRGVAVGLSKRGERSMGDREGRCEGSREGKRWGMYILMQRDTKKKRLVILRHHLHHIKWLNRAIYPTNVAQ